jgi:hypothetical protein
MTYRPMHPLPKLLTLIQINGDVRAAGRSIEDRDARGGQGGSGSSVRHHAVLVAHYVFEHRVAGGFGLVESFRLEREVTPCRTLNGGLF